MPKMTLRCASSEVGLAEILIALHELRPDKDKTCSLIAEALGLGWRGVEKNEDKIVKPHFSLTEIMDDVTPELKVPMQFFNSENPTYDTDEILKPSGHEDPIYEIYDDSILESIDALDQTDTALHMGRARYEPLLNERSFNSLMGKLLATPGVSQEIDWSALERDLARGMLLERIPFKHRPTLKRGVLLFLDHSESMQPFWHDEEELLKRLMRFLGRSKVQVWSFGVIRRLSVRPKLRWYSSPPRQLPIGTPLLLVSDFGIRGELSSGYLDIDPWLPILDLARKYNCPISALIPAPEVYWPIMLRLHIPNSLVWDRDTSVAALRRCWQRIH